MQLGQYSLENPVFMAPMAGITDKAFREVIRLTGGKYCVTEMISDKALLFANPKTIKMLDLKEEEEPRIVQIFGSEPVSMAKAAKIAVSYGANILDINMGCPTPKIVKNGEGAALLKNLPLAEEIAARIVDAVQIPVTVKMRLGWDSDAIVAPELVCRLQKVGISMVTIHARTREQFYAGRADWNWISRIKSIAKIPVIGNGDITTPEQAKSMLTQTGCDGVMIARGALGKPWLIGITQKFLNSGEICSEPSPKEKYRILVTHFEKLLFYKGEKIGVNEMRKHACWYLKGLRKASEYRNLIMSTQNSAAMKDVFRKIFSEYDN